MPQLFPNHKTILIFPSTCHIFLILRFQKDRRFDVFQFFRKLLIFGKWFVLWHFAQIISFSEPMIYILFVLIIFILYFRNIDFVCFHSDFLSTLVKKRVWSIFVFSQNLVLWVTSYFFLNIFMIGLLQPWLIFQNSFHLFLLFRAPIWYFIHQANIWGRLKDPFLLIKNICISILIIVKSR